MSAVSVEAAKRRMQYAALCGLATAFATCFVHSEDARRAENEARQADRGCGFERKGRKAHWRYSVWCDSGSNDPVMVWSVTFKGAELRRLEFAFCSQRPSMVDVSCQIGQEFNYFKPDVPLIEDERFARGLEQVRQQMLLCLRAVKAPVWGSMAQLLRG